MDHRPLLSDKTPIFEQRKNETKSNRNNNTEDTREWNKEGKYKMVTQDSACVVAVAVAVVMVVSFPPLSVL